MDLENKALILCDSMNALQKLLTDRKDLARRTIISSSPSLLRNNPKNAASLNHNMSPVEFKNQRELTKKIVKKTFHHFRKNRSHSFSLCCASTVLEASKVFSKLYALSLHGPANKYVICKYFDNASKKTELLNFPWENFIPKEKVELYEYSESIPYKFKHDEIGLFNRLMKAGLKNVAYRIFIKLFKAFPFFLSRKKILIYKENDLLMESAVEMVFKGFSLHYIKPSKDSLSKKGSTIINDEDKQLIIKDWLDLLTPELKISFSNYFNNLLSEEIKRFYSFQSRWETTLNRYDLNTIKAVFTNSPNRVDSRSLFSILNELNVPLFSFQHGVTREISKYHDLVEVNFEGNSSHHFITFNKESEKISNCSDYSLAQTFAAGTSQRFTNIPQSTSTEKKPFIYVSTNLPRGYSSFFMGDHDDYEDSLEEEKVIHKILSQTNQNVDFKPYLFDNRRYPDEDFLTKQISKNSISNVSLMAQKIDMRYLLNEYEVIITTKATSTVSWPILGNVPTVFLNFHNSSPLRDEIVEDFQKSIFLFDLKEEKDYRLVVDFLNQPMENIKVAWRAKEEEREKIIKKYFSEDLKFASKNAASYITNQLS